MAATTSQAANKLEKIITFIILNLRNSVDEKMFGEFVCKLQYVYLLVTVNVCYRTEPPGWCKDSRL